MTPLEMEDDVQQMMRQRRGTGGQSGTELPSTKNLISIDEDDSASATTPLGVEEERRSLLQDDEEFDGGQCRTGIASLKSSRTIADGDLWGRWISRYLSRAFPSWYGRHASLEEAWSYYEHFTLPRRYLRGTGTGGDGNDYTRARPGAAVVEGRSDDDVDGKAAATKLYPPWTTPQSALREFGTGIAVYFATLRALALVCVVAGAILSPAIIRRRESESSSSSLVCTDTEWVPCPTCSVDDDVWSNARHRIAVTDDGLVFALGNKCNDLGWVEVWTHLAAVSFLVVAITGVGIYQQKLERTYDEGILTASDFSIKVSNPPPDATDPEEWRRFFCGLGEGTGVAYCTIALDNEELVKALAERRRVLHRLKHSLPEDFLDSKGTSHGDEIRERMNATDERLYQKLVATEGRCRDLMHQCYAVSAVFITFETEAAQRRVLKALSSQRKSGGRWASESMEHSSDSTAAGLLFRGDRILHVTESVEPSSVRWQDLDETPRTRSVQQVFTFLLTSGLIFAGFQAIKRAYQKENVNLVAILITTLNLAMPLAFKKINRLESHPNEGSYQASLYLKICAFRWINTACVLLLVHPFTSTIEQGKDGLIAAVHALLRAEVVVGPTIRMCDFVGNFRRLILAPLATNQTSMNAHFRGSKQFMGEKYTNTTKVLFLCFFFSVIFPTGLLYGAAALSVTYLTDKFLLVRSWGALPELGDDIARYSRVFFFPLTLAALATMSLHFWLSYPFDGICETDDLIGPSHGEYSNYHSGATSSKNVVNWSNKRVYAPCNQAFLTLEKYPLAYLYVSVLAIVLFHCYRYMGKCKQLRMGMLNTDQEELDSKQTFSSVDGISAYIPQIRDEKFLYPLLACSIEKLEKRHIGWEDPAKGYSHHCMANDIKLLGGTENNSGGEPILSTVTYWPPTDPVDA